MATNILPRERFSTPISREQAADRPQTALWRDVLAPMASLKITVVLFACSIFLILVGTLAQVDMDMWQVIDLYFRAWISWIDFQIFFPRSWFPNWQNVPGGFWFPGGATIGLALCINLIAAHLAIFTIQARGTRLATGLVTLALGIGYTAIVITSGHNPDGLQGEPPLAWSTIWLLMKAGLAVGAAACAVVAVAYQLASRRVEGRLLWIVAVTLGLSSAILFGAGERAYSLLGGDSGMRILWQLIQASAASTVLLAGCMLLFGTRGGRVLLHGGVALVMFGQFYVSQYDIEEQVTIQEGQTATFARDIRQTELAVVDTSDPEVERVAAIPRSLLLASAEGQTPRWWQRLVHGAGLLDDQGVIHAEKLPFGVKVLSYHKNARLRDVKPGEENPATAGTGLRFVAVPAKAASGATSGGQVDMAAAYVQLIDKNGSKPLATYLVSQIAAAQDVAERFIVNGKTYEISLRFQQNYKPYTITLLDVRKDDYLGTSTPRNYSSTVRLLDRDRDVDREVRIWMNNPLRYAGETFYQSGYSGPPSSPVETTTLQVVTNSGWMIPYVACMIVVFGMGAQFTNVLVRFLRRRTDVRGGGWSFQGAPTADILSDPPTVRETGSDRRRRKSKVSDPETADLNAVERARSFRSRVGSIGLALLLLLLAGWLAGKFVPPRPAKDGLEFYQFGQLPLIAEGRVKPFDTLARNTLRAIANRETFKDDSGQRQPAIRWLLDVIASPAKAERHRVFRIDNMEVLDTLGLKRRQGNLYSVAEIRQGVDAFEKQVTQARRKDLGDLTTYERKLLELDQQIRTYTRVAGAFQPLELPPLPSPHDDEKASQQKIEAFRLSYANFVQSLERVQPPLAVPLQTNFEGRAEPQWQSYARAWTDAYIGARLLGQTPDPALTQLESVFVAYSRKDAKEFNQQVAAYHRLLRQNPPAELKSETGIVTRMFGSFYGFEAYFNHVAPFYHAAVLYLVAFVLTACGWLGWSKPLNRAAFLLLLGTALIHTLALVARIYISGRPPVTNLYSSAVFIGWGGVLLAMVFEWLYRNGIGNAVAAIMGFATLLIAHSLAASGDTFTVLQAVLDTQFWLATHVVAITFGYATTFLAGALGMMYVFGFVVLPAVLKLLNRVGGLALASPLRAETSKELTRMIYGTLCFSIFFSFFGTVLGGLWADDSWGRFWGWDPKENGALIIVLWTALVLHARWGGMVRERGLAVLTIGGNIVTAWSWFGVNELGVGLHSYGFTEGVLLALGLFVGSQLLIIAAGCLPRSLWSNPPLAEKGS